MKILNLLYIIKIFNFFGNSRIKTNSFNLYLNSQDINYVYNNRTNDKSIKYCKDCKYFIPNYDNLLLSKCKLFFNEDYETKERKFQRAQKSREQLCGHPGIYFEENNNNDQENKLYILKKQEN